MNKQHQKGFTLLELAIVLVIIGIILGAILKGQELINNAKTKRLLNDMKGLAAIQYSFYDRYGRFAGDCDANGAIDFPDMSAPVGAFGPLNNPDFCYDPSNPTPDYGPDTQWKELVKANFFPTVQHVRDLVKHPFSGALYSASYSTTINQRFLQFNVIVATEVPCFAAKTIDVAIDGNIDATKGSIRKANTGLALEDQDPTWGCQNENDLVHVVYFFDRREK